ncbi:helix-turn-helix transcriptional regulator [Nonomuraea sp. NEAU-A123]|uniref:ArsR/SmtB family transcription factor n=1 Tax=unclassified Nonomuraea TaxID=2593643 RepID=UPI001BE40494|nr:helix-turn-helix domain-containing protein [Nonomuraea sp. NEAU-A123]MBT2235148.1 ArsR family transcriptional regulator [Nonomuraea sp. NEAU-A123]
MLIEEMHPATAELRLPKVLAALADPARLLTVRALHRAGESACTRLQQAAGLTISRSTFSHHQRVLREAGVIQVRVRGSERILSLRRDDLDACFPGLLDAVLGTAPEHIGS